MQTYTKKTLLLLSMLALATVASAAWNEPFGTPISGNLPAPLTTLSTGQWRSGALAVGTTDAPLTNFILDINGFIKTAGTGVVFSVFGDSYIQGSLMSDTLAHNGTEKEVCTNSSGVLSLCGQSQTNKTVVVDNTPAGVEQFTVPAGVTEMTVEIWGAGGGGFYYQNTNSGSHNCTSPTLDRYGKPTTFVSSTGTSSLNLVANGGGCGYSGNTGGVGGTASGSGSMIVSGTLSAINGEAGQSGGMGNQSYQVVTLSCGTLVLGALGGNGGAGGISGPVEFAYSPQGGTYGVGDLDTANCTINGSPVGIIYGPYAPDVSTPSSPGTGGAGAPGTAGSTKFRSISLGDCAQVANTGDRCEGGNGYPGGGGGGYVKVVLTVNPGDVFNYTVGAAYQNPTTYSYGSSQTPGFLTCSSGNWKFSFNCGTHSGYGAHGQVKITY